MNSRPIEYIVAAGNFRARFSLTGSRIGEQTSCAMLSIEEKQNLSSRSSIWQNNESIWKAKDSIYIDINPQDFSRKEMEQCVAKIAQLELENKVLKDMLEGKA
jgi:hypothetical protein